MILVVDYGMGNLRSVSKALESLGAQVRVSSDPRDVAQADKIVLPGVGAFPAAMQELRRRRLVDPIAEVLEQGKPYLGICLGLQLLFEYSEEAGGAEGLKVLPGAVRQFPINLTTSGGQGFLKVPHIGWNQIVRRPTSLAGGEEECPLLLGIPDGSFFYFVHSFYPEPTRPELTVLETQYGEWFTSMVCRDNIFATQFHPEKSQALGLKLLENFIRL